MLPRVGKPASCPLHFGAIEKGQDPLEVPVRRGGQDLSLLQTPASSCQPRKPSPFDGQGPGTGWGCWMKETRGQQESHVKFVHWNIYVCVHTWCACMMSQ